ncbi:MAG: hypothetical protein F9K42_08050 [Ignavibacterium sp.]|nr:MAG: hypothetical protein F9K42_08050 [Ignavibacterium sp.]
MKRLAIMLIAILLISCFSCISGTEPEEKKSIREYTWTVDTIAYEGASQTLMYSVWGSSASNVYITGHTDIGYGKLWRYTGFIWKHIDVFQDVPIGPISLEDVHGTGSDNVWVVGSRFSTNPAPPPNFLHQSLILQYNGNKWIEHNVKTKSSVYAVHAVTPTDVWACGADGLVYHYDGNTWDIDTMKVSAPVDGLFQSLSIAKFDNNIYMMAVKIENSGLNRTDYFYKMGNNTWALQDTFIHAAGNILKWGSKLYKTSFNKLYSYGEGGIYELEGSEWKNIYSNGTSVTGLYETGEKNILITTSYSKAFYYDGNTWEEITVLRNTETLFSGVYMDNSEVFITGYILSDFPMKSIVIRGK